MFREIEHFHNVVCTCISWTMVYVSTQVAMNVYRIPSARGGVIAELQHFQKRVCTTKLIMLWVTNLFKKLMFSSCRCIPVFIMITWKIRLSRTHTRTSVTA